MRHKSAVFCTCKTHNFVLGCNELFPLLHTVAVVIRTRPSPLSPRIRIASRCTECSRGFQPTLVCYTIPTSRQRRLIASLPQ